MTKIIINPPSNVTLPLALTRNLYLTLEKRQLKHWHLIDAPPLADIAREAVCFTQHPVTIDYSITTYPLSPLVPTPWRLWTTELTEDMPIVGPPRPAFLPRTTAGKLINCLTQNREIIFNRSVIPFHQEIITTARRLLADSPPILANTMRSFSFTPLNFKRSHHYPQLQATVNSLPSSTPPPYLLNLAGRVFKSCRLWAELDWLQDRDVYLTTELIGHPRAQILDIPLYRNIYLDEKINRVKSSTRNISRVLKTIPNLLNQELTQIVRLRLERATGARVTSPFPPLPRLQTRNSRR
ncbi:MAG: hypothetical protein AMR96_04270 [Candidatus Adiutrix intracellularis]|nr:MAG: hypothetical protein AMR96_04270 [Candidatus Adiutrix intracellularis]